MLLKWSHCDCPIQGCPIVIVPLWLSHSRMPLDVKAMVHLGSYHLVLTRWGHLVTISKLRWSPSSSSHISWGAPLSGYEPWTRYERVFFGEGVKWSWELTHRQDCKVPDDIDNDMDHIHSFSTEGVNNCRAKLKLIDNSGVRESNFKNRLWLIYWVRK